MGSDEKPMKVEQFTGTFNIRHNAGRRSPGLHQSSILRAIALRVGKLKLDDEEEDLDLLLLKYPDMQTGDSGVFARIALGLAWEEWYGRQLCAGNENFHYHFGELSRDGIHCSPDAALWHELIRNFSVHEFKVTWKSSRKWPIESQWMWLHQVRAYCYLLGSTTAYIHVYYVNGNYRGSGPQLAVYGLQFTREETEQTWNMILNNRGLGVPESGQSPAQPLPHGPGPGPEEALPPVTASFTHTGTTVPAGTR